MSVLYGLLNYAIGTLVVFLAIIIFMMVVLWKIFTKAGEEGWKSIIPVYNIIVYFKIIGLPWWMVLIAFSPIIAMFLNLLSLISLCSLASLAVSIISSIKLGQVFGQENGFIVGLCLLSIIFMPILAFSKEIQYLGPDVGLNFGGKKESDINNPQNYNKTMNNEVNNPQNYNYSMNNYTQFMNNNVEKSNDDKNI